MIDLKSARNDPTATRAALERRGAGAFALYAGEAARKRAVARTVREVADYLGNTPAVARASYIDPRLFERFEDGTTISHVLTEIGDETRTIVVNPTSPDFSISVAEAAKEVFPGGSATYTVTVTPASGFNAPVTLSVASESGFPSGITSGGFSQGNRFVIVTDEAMRARIAELADEEKYVVASGLEPWISRAPAHIVVAMREGDEQLAPALLHLVGVERRVAQHLEEEVHAFFQVA